MCYTSVSHFHYRNPPDVTSDSHACREKCLRSDEPPVPAAEGIAVAPREPKTGRVEVMAADEVVSAPSPNRCWMECSWKQGSDSRTEEAREILQRIKEKRMKRVREEEEAWIEQDVTSLKNKRNINKITTGQTG